MPQTCVFLISRMWPCQGLADDEKEEGEEEAGPRKVPPVSEVGGIARSILGRGFGGVGTPAIIDNHNMHDDTIA